MALGDNTFTQVFTTTLQKYEKTLVDNVLLEHPVLELFKASAKSYTGRGLVIPVRAANLSATVYDNSGSGEHATAVSDDILGSAVYNWADTIITPFRLKHNDIIQNSGTEQIVNLVEEYVKAAAADHADFIVAQLHQNTATFTTGNIMPLDMVFGNASSDAYFDGVNADWTAVGGIDPNDAGKTYWQSTRIESSAASEDISAAFRRITNEIYRASRKRPTHVIVGFDIYEELEAYLVEKGQYQLLAGGTAQLRFSALKFGDLEVRLDPDCADDRAYFLNKDSLRFGYCSGEFMKSYPAQPLQGTLDTVVPVASRLMFGTVERRANGLLIRVA
tara:strand:+ start:1980 stop:2975 length:996 start_codon:yes stop_codon:yes gene_type:complete